MKTSPAVDMYMNLFVLELYKNKDLANDWK